MKEIATFYFSSALHLDFSWDLSISEAEIETFISPSKTEPIYRDIS
jgi:hypothetical protein